eukprot:4021650-Pleurochrysis_carterae.AAC.2
MRKVLPQRAQPKDVAASRESTLHKAFELPGIPREQRRAEYSREIDEIINYNNTAEGTRG